MTPLRDWCGDRSGAAAVIFALVSPVLIGSVAMFTEFRMQEHVRSQLQQAADAAALAAVTQLGDQAEARELAIRFAAGNVAEGFGEVTTADDVVFGVYDPGTRSFTPSTENVNAVSVAAVRSMARGNALGLPFAGLLGTDSVDLAARAIAARTITIHYNPPVVMDLEPEAADFNRVSVYCFDYMAPGPAAARRSQMTAIADNVGGVLDFDWPQCEAHESMSFMLFNVRHAKADPSLMNAHDRQKYVYFSDTSVENGVSHHHFGFDILETVRCDTIAECTHGDPTSILPHGKNRTPQVENRPCLPGKFMYFGFEDRPPGMGWTDRDYDDIVVVMECPTGEDVHYGVSRLVQ